MNRTLVTALRTGLNRIRRGNGEPPRWVSSTDDPRDVEWLAAFNADREPQYQLSMDELIEARRELAWRTRQEHMTNGTLLSNIERSYKVAVDQADRELIGSVSILANMVDAAASHDLGRAVRLRRAALVAAARQDRDKALQTIRDDLAQVAEQRRGAYARLRNEARKLANPPIDQAIRDQAAQIVNQARTLPELRAIHADALSAGDDHLAYAIEQAGSAPGMIPDQADQVQWRDLAIEQGMRRAAGPIGQLERSEGELAELAHQVAGHLLTSEGVNQANMIGGPSATDDSVLEGLLTNGTGLWRLPSIGASPAVPARPNQVAATPTPAAAPTTPTPPALALVE